MASSSKSIYQRAGEWGVPFGLYLSCVAVLSIFADWFAPLQLLFMVLLMGLPLVTYYFQRRKFIEDNGFTEYAGLWMLGIMLYILGTVLCSFITFLVITYCRPGFIYEQAQAAVDVYRTMPQMRDNEMVNLLQQAIDDKALPSPLELVMSVFWFASFAGSLVSALTALVAQRPLPGKSARRRQ